MKKVHGEIYPMIFQLSTLSLISGTLYQTTGERLPSWPYLEKHKKFGLSNTNTNPAKK